MEREPAWRQMFFGFLDSIVQKKSPAGREARPLPFQRRHVEEPVQPQAENDVEEASPTEGGTGDPTTDPAKKSGRDHALEAQAREWLDRLGLHEGAMKLRVEWNARLRSTAGYAKWPFWRVELNPKLVAFEGQVDRTLRHELAHLIAYARAGRRRIEPHGPEWRKACADLGIPDESVRHTLPLPRSKQSRNFVYRCPACALTVERVKPFHRHTACLACCKKHNRGRYDLRFQFVLIEKRD